MGTVVTGEGVELEVDAATVLPRAVACLLDYLIYIGTYVLCWSLPWRSSSTDRPPGP